MSVSKSYPLNVLGGVQTDTKPNIVTCLGTTSRGSGGGPVDDGSFKFTIQTDIEVAGNKDFDLRWFTGTFVNDIEVDWGDDNIEVITGGTTNSHSYTEVGTYQISIKPTVEGGEMPVWYMRASTATREQIISIDKPFISWVNAPTSGATSVTGLFSTFKNLTFVCAEVLKNNTQLTTLKDAFKAGSSEPFPMTTPPVDFHKGMVNVTDISNEFLYQRNITGFEDSYNEDLTALELANYAYEYCEEAVSLPAFKTCLLLREIQYFAGYCYKAVIKSDMFGADLSERFDLLTASFNASFAFYRPLTYQGSIQGVAPRIDTAIYPAGSSNSRCFDGIGNEEGLSNWDDIEATWK